MKVDMAEMYVDDEIRKAVLDVLDGGRYIKGPQGRALGQEFADYCGAAFGIPCNSGTSALMLAMNAIGIGKGDEVIVPSHTFIATANAVAHMGGRPVFADIEEDTYTLSADSVRSLVTERTKAVVPVHIYGQPVSMDPIMEIAQEHGLRVIEDACQAHGAEYNGKKVGSIGDIACFSFFPSKNMTVAGDGGIAVTSDPDLSESMTMLCDQGRKKGEKYKHDLVGYNFRLSEILAAVGRVQLRHLPEWIEKRQRIAQRYDDEFGGSFVTPKVADDRTHVYYVYTIQTDDRDALAAHLKERDISTNIYYPLPLHQQPAMQGFGGGGALPVTERLFDRILSLPMYPALDDEKLAYVIESVKGYMGV